MGEKKIIYILFFIRKYASLKKRLCKEAEGE